MPADMITSLSAQYIYLLQEREFIKTKEKIYKLGKTKQKNGKRFSQYPKDSVLLLQMVCINCDENEKKLLTIFKTKYKQRVDIGTEYFEGDYKTMMIDIYTINLNELMTPTIIPPSNQISSTSSLLSDNEYSSDYLYENVPETFNVDTYTEFVRLTGFKAKIKITNKTKHSGFICMDNELLWRKINDDSDESLKGYLEFFINSYDVKSQVDEIIHSKTVQYNIDNIIKDICSKYYDKNNKKTYVFPYNQHLIYTSMNGTEKAIPKIFNGSFVSIEHIDSIICEKPTSLFYIKDNINIDIVTALLNTYVKSPSILKVFNQLCYNIFTKESEIETIFYEFYNKHEQTSVYNNNYEQLSKLLSDLVYYVFKNDYTVITSNDYYINKKKYNKTKPRAMIIEESDDYTVKEMIDECIKIGVKNIIIRENNNANNIYNIEAYKNYINNNTNILLSYSMNPDEYDTCSNYKKNNPLICQSLLRTNFLKWCSSRIYS